MTDRPRTATALFVGARNGVTTGLPVAIMAELEGWDGGVAIELWVEAVDGGGEALTVGTILVTVTVWIAASVTVTVTILPPWFAIAELDAAGDTAAGDVAAGATAGA
jgi:hypothetical protein